MRRSLLLLVVLATGCGLGWRWAHPGDLRVDVDPRSREVALLFPAEARGLRTADAVARALAEFSEDGRGALRDRIAREFARGGERLVLGFVPGQAADLRAGTAEPAEGGKTIPGLARVQLRGVAHGYLLVHAAPAESLLRTAERRRWLGRALVEAGAQAESATIAVGESDDGAFLVATLAFAYRTGEEAETALRRLTEKQGDYGALGFAARPGTDRITRTTKLLVVRFDIETDIVLQALGRR